MATIASKPVAPTTSPKSAPGAELLKSLNQKDASGKVRVGMTTSGDFILAQDSLQLTKAGQGTVALANAKLATLNNRRDDIVLLTATQDVYVASSSALTVPTGKAPVEGDKLTLATPDGKLVTGTVKRVDSEGQDASKADAQAAQAAAQARARQAQIDALVAQDRIEQAQLHAQGQAAAKQAADKQRHQQEAGAAAAGGLLLLMGGAAAAHGARRGFH